MNERLIAFGDSLLAAHRKFLVRHRLPRRSSFTRGLCREMLNPATPVGPIHNGRPSTYKTSTILIALWRYRQATIGLRAARQ